MRLLNNHLKGLKLRLKLNGGETLPKPENLTFHQGNSSLR